MNFIFSWSIEPAVIIWVSFLLVVYLIRWRRVRRENGVTGANYWRLASFLCGLTVIVIALMGPIDVAADRFFLMHMVQHVLLIDFAPILLLLGLNKILLRPITRRFHRIERSVGLLTHPAVAVTFYAATMWIWHLRAPYDLAASQPVWHAVEHMQFLTAGLFFWWFLITPIPPRYRLSGLGSLVYVGVNKLIVGALGIVITFSPRLLYGYYANQDTRSALSTLSDQRAGGAVMELEQTGLLFIVILILFSKMIDRSEREAVRKQRLEKV